MAAPLPVHEVTREGNLVVAHLAASSLTGHAAFTALTGTIAVDIFDLPPNTVIADIWIDCILAEVGATNCTLNILDGASAAIMSGTTDNMGALGRDPTGVDSFLAGVPTTEARRLHKAQLVYTGTATTAPAAMVRLLASRLAYGSP